MNPLCIVVDFCDGGSLFALLRNKTLTDAEKIGFGLDISRGMLHLHTAIPGKAIIHRDLAARNILINRNKALVADFGMARMTKEDTSKTNQNIGPLVTSLF